MVSSTDHLVPVGPFSSISFGLLGFHESHCLSSVTIGGRRLGLAPMCNLISDCWTYAATFELTSRVIELAAAVEQYLEGWTHGPRCLHQLLAS